MALSSRVSTKVAAASIVAFSLLATPVHAQFGRLIPRDVRNVVEDATDDDDNPCETKEKTSTASRVLGGIFGRTSRRAARDVGISSYLPMGEFSDQLSTAIACQLAPEEQKQAAEATLRATSSVAVTGTDQTDETDDALPPPVRIGSRAEWKSETRDDVSGTSTVTARNASGGDGADCITVTDVIIVGGEETKADKRMCRPPGSRRYSIVA